MKRPVLISELKTGEDFLRSLLVKVDDEFHADEWNALQGELCVGNIGRAEISWRYCGSAFDIVPFSDRDIPEEVVKEITDKIVANNEGVCVNVIRYEGAFNTDCEFHLYFND